VNDSSEHVLAAALRAQADIATGPPPERTPRPEPVPLWAVLVAAAVVGAVAGVLTGLISLL
jgi:ABC-type branched-subunit amino acid transport system permease subunit